MESNGKGRYDVCSVITPARGGKLTSDVATDGTNSVPMERAVCLIMLFVAVKPSLREDSTDGQGVHDGHVPHLMRAIARDKRRYSLACPQCGFSPPDCPAIVLTGLRQRVGIYGAVHPMALCLIGAASVRVPMKRGADNQCIRHQPQQMPHPTRRTPVDTSCSARRGA